MNRSSVFGLVAIFLGACTPLLAGVSVVPEPSLVALTAVGVGAIILIARRKRGR